MVTEEAAKTLKQTWAVPTLVKGFSSLETFFIRGKTQLVSLKLHSSARIASEISFA